MSKAFSVKENVLSQACADSLVEIAPPID